MALSVDASKMNTFGDRILLALKRLQALLQPAPRQLTQTLKNAESLLSYAADNGIEVEADVAQRIVSAQLSGKAAWNSPATGALIADISKLAATVSRVTNPDIAHARRSVRAQLYRYTWIAVALAALIVPLSIESFITTSISSAITADVEKENELVVSLHTELYAQAKDAPQSLSAAATDLQQFAATLRTIKDNAVRLEHVAFWNQDKNLSDQWLANLSWKNFEVDPALQNRLEPLQKETSAKTQLYQRIRRQVADGQSEVSLSYGAVTAYILPLLYALLGACAFLLRLFSNEVNTGTFSPTYAIPGRFFIALIGGLIVSSGLFNSITQGAALQPMGVAFLMGYASDIFFSSLDGLLAKFKKTS